MKNDGDNCSSHNDDSGNSEVHCSEAEWRVILSRGRAEAKRFLKLYKTIPVKYGEDRLDKCAVAMGWQLAGSDGREETDELPFEFDEPIKPPPPTPAVYSLHNTPEAIAMFALFENISELLLSLFPLVEVQTPLRAVTLASCAETVKALANAERDMLLAIDAMDASEHGLATILMKNSLEALNTHFPKLSKMLSGGSMGITAKKIVEEIHTSVFDLRELCLRVIRDATAESDTETDE